MVVCTPPLRDTSALGEVCLVPTPEERGANTHTHPVRMPWCLRISRIQDGDRVPSRDSGYSAHRHPESPEAGLNTGSWRTTSTMSKHDDRPTARVADVGRVIVLSASSLQIAPVVCKWVVHGSEKRMGHEDPVGVSGSLGSPSLSFCALQN